ncbi:MAG: hypothetical protein BAJATHORv1_20083 [Candidatus Thorarchaeota archaeon]|nr:MAG: hypothetical protein BAJATHORv1_20083 [Candidatus Thorarchaeota archaeon]
MSTTRELELEMRSPRLLEILRRQGGDKLTDFQISALQLGIMREKNQVLVTYDYEEAYQIAEISLLHKMATDFRAIGAILCPNPHAANQTLKNIGNKCIRLGIDVTLIDRRRKAIQSDLKIGRVIVATYRAFNIAIRNHPEILDNLRSVVIRRMDLIGKKGIGARLENIIVKIMGLEQDVQYIAICPPVADITELAKWLKADTVEDPKPDVKRIFSVKTFEGIDKQFKDLTEYIHYSKGLTLILCSNMSTCENIAKRLAGLGNNPDETLDLRLTPEHRDRLIEAANRIQERYSDCTMTQRLGKTLSRGVTFIHEGVASSQRRVLSKAWKDGIVPVLVMPTRFAIASGMKASVVFLMGVFMQSAGMELSKRDVLTMLTEWELDEVLHSAGRIGKDNEGFGTVVTDSELERKRVLTKYFVKNDEGYIFPIKGEVDSLMDNLENIQDLILNHLCQPEIDEKEPYSVINRTFWASINRTTDLTRGIIPNEDIEIEELIAFRATKTSQKRAQEIDDEMVSLVSVTPYKIEGLVRSQSRDLWHLVSLRTKEGVSCSCESWKYQGLKRHRLCKHLIKFSRFVIQEEETKPYATGVLRQAFRGLEILDDLERNGLVQRVGKKIDCTELGKSVSILGVPIRDAKRVLKALSKKEDNITKIIERIVVSRTGLPKKMVSRIVSTIETEDISEITCEEDFPGIIENCIEEIQYVNQILLSFIKTDEKTSLGKESQVLEKQLLKILAAIS